MTKLSAVFCPNCRRPSPWEGNPYRPFCCERCRLVDLGAWIDESYRLPAEDGAGSDDEKPIKDRDMET